MNNKWILKGALIALVAVFSLSACGQKKKADDVVKLSLEQAQEQLGAFEQQLMDKQEALMADESLSDADREQQFYAYYEEIYDQMIEAAKKIARDNGDSEAGVYAINELRGEIEDSEMAELIAGLTDEMKAQDKIVKISKALSAREGAAEGMPFVDFQIQQDPEDPASVARLSDYVGQGKYILVDFWASWCGPCRREIPNIKQVWEDFHGDAFDVLSVAVWDRLEDTRAAAEELGIVWNQIINAGTVPTDAYGIEGIPQIILFGPDGTILQRNLRGENIRKAVSEALAE